MPGIDLKASTARSVQKDLSLSEATTQKEVPESCTTSKTRAPRVVPGAYSEASIIRSPQKDRSSPKLVLTGDRSPPPEEEVTPAEAATMPEGVVAMEAMAAPPMDGATTGGMHMIGEGTFEDASA